MTAKVMGILNVTPDSFSDGGAHALPDQALEKAKKMIASGADIIDIGGESSRPGAPPVSLSEELARVLPVVEVLKEYITQNRLHVEISVDTYKPRVMEQVLELGADMINDIFALREPGAIQVCAEYDKKVCLMHMQGLPETMQQNLTNSCDIVDEVLIFLEARIQVCIDQGIGRENICIDPGFGFGKTFEDNWILLAHMHRLHSLGCPILVGTSRKSMLGSLINKPVNQRVHASVASIMIALEQGANILRVHDLEPTVDALKVFNQVNIYKQTNIYK